MTDPVRIENIHLVTDDDGNRTVEFVVPDGVGRLTVPSRFPDRHTRRQERIGPVNVADFLPDGWRPGDYADDAFDAALAAVRRFRTAGTAKLVVPGRNVIYRLARTIHLDRAVHLAGEGPAGNNPAARLVFDDGVPGIICHRHSTSTDGGRADWSVIENLSLVAAGKTVPDADGIHTYTRIAVRDVYIQGFSRHGIYIDGNPTHTGGANANCFHIEHSRIVHCGFHGLHAIGADSNAGTVIQLDTSQNEGWGIYDHSFLGNTYLGCHSESNGRHAQVHHARNRYYLAPGSSGSSEPGTDNTWRLVGPGGRHHVYPDWTPDGTYREGGAIRTRAPGNVSGNSFIGCYTEAGQPPSDIRGPSLILGGMHGAGFTDESAGSAGRMTFGPTFSPRVDVKAAGQTVRVGDGYLLRWKRDDATHVLGWSLNPPGSLPGWWETTWANSAIYSGLAIADEGNGQVPPGSVRFPKGYYLNDGARLVRRTVGTAPPTTGTHRRGDTVENRRPSAGGWAGWVCVEPGTPGVWKGYGLIES